MEDQKEREEVFKNARVAAQQLRARLDQVRIVFGKDAKAVGVFVPKALALIHDIEAYIRKAEKDL